MKLSLDYTRSKITPSKETCHFQCGWQAQTNSTHAYSILEISGSCAISLIMDEVYKGQPTFYNLLWIFRQDGLSQLAVFSKFSFNIQTVETTFERIIYCVVLLPSKICISQLVLSFITHKFDSKFPVSSNVISFSKNFRPFIYWKITITVFSGNQAAF